MLADKKLRNFCQVSIGVCEAQESCEKCSSSVNKRIAKEKKSEKEKDKELLET